MDNLSIGAKYLTNRKVTNTQKEQTEKYINNQTNIQTEQELNVNILT